MLFSPAIQIDVFDHDGSGAPDLIGSFQTSLHQLSHVRHVLGCPTERLESL